MTTIRRLSCAAALCAALVPARAEPITTDRPDFVESSDVVDAGRVQIESGLQFERDSSGDDTRRLRSTPVLLRFGLGRSLEARIETDGALRSHDTVAGVDSKASGAADVSLGIKWRSNEGDEATGKASTAWLLHVDVDSGSAEFRGQGLRPSLRYVAEWELPHGWSVGIMPGIVRDRDDAGQRYVNALFAVTTGKEITPEWRAFFEIALPRIAKSKHGGTQASFDTGLAWVIGNDVQLDAYVQRGLTRETADWAAGVGFSIRF
jgi:hypothetical protein